MSREFLTRRELDQFFHWLDINNFAPHFNEIDPEGIELVVQQGQFYFEVRHANPEHSLYEVHNYSEHNNIEKLITDFNDRRLFIYGVKVTRHLIEQFVPLETWPWLDCFAQFRIYRNNDKGWTVFGVIGRHMQVIATGNYQIALRAFGPNFLEEYWTAIYTMQKENNECFQSRI